MAKKGFYLNYDQENDILNVSFGSARRAISFEREPEVYFRVDPKSYELVGLTVLGFKQNFLSQKQEVRITPSVVAKMFETQTGKSLGV